ncbi:hypothetical protein CEXT_224711 [Caerostris extrusa]|uniref:Uncharacterized protein n=1 Tax=Caerostris extrusa TaxID=172846 RepID=A0AAV4ULN9_CAEEX|nr:hypothetical protein CEXT_224711 [Caerostris extrusa]
MKFISLSKYCSRQPARPQKGASSIGNAAIESLSKKPDCLKLSLPLFCWLFQQFYTLTRRGTPDAEVEPAALSIADRQKKHSRSNSWSADVAILKKISHRNQPTVATISQVFPQ